MGLLDLPDFNSAAGQGLLAASLSLMGAQKMPGQKGAFGSALANAGRTYMDTRNQAGEQMQAQEYKRLQLDALKRKMEQEDQMRKAAQGAFRSPEMANAMSQGPMPDGSDMPTIKPGFDTEKYTQSLYGIDPLTAMDFESKLNKDKPLINVAPGGTLYDPKTGQSVFTSPKEAAPSDLSRLMAEMSALPPDSPMRRVYQQQISKMTTHAPPSNVSVNTNMPTQESEQSKTYGKGMGDIRIEIQKAGFQAPSTVAALDRMEELLNGVDGGKFSPAGLEVARAAKSLGIEIDPRLGNKEAAESLAIELANKARPVGSGPMTDKDFDNYLKIVPGLAKTPEGRRQITATLKAKAKRDLEIAKKAREYARKNNGVIDDGFLDEAAEYVAKTPVFQSASNPVDSLVDKYRSR